MNLLNQLKSQKGFSLVELMVVVAIIGILATIGIPQYQKFMSKARQSEAKTYLNTIAQGEAAFFTEYNGYSVNMKVIGAAASGNNLRYSAGFSINACTNYPALATGVPPENQGAADDSNDFNDTLVAPGGTTWTYFTVGTESDTGIGATTACDFTRRTFTAMAWGNPTNTNGAAPNNANNNLDRFTIDQLRLVRHLSIGM